MSVLFFGAWGLELVVEYEYETAAYTPPDVADIALEEAVDSLLGHGLPEAVSGARVLDLHISALATTLHHEFPADGVQRERNGLRSGYYQLGEEELLQEASLLQVLLVPEHPPLPRVVAPEVERPVDEDSSH